MNFEAFNYDNNKVKDVKILIVDVGFVCVCV